LTAPLTMFFFLGLVSFGKGSVFIELRVGQEGGFRNCSGGDDASPGMLQEPGEVEVEEAAREKDPATVGEKEEEEEEDEEEDEEEENEEEENGEDSPSEMLLLRCGESKRCGGVCDPEKGVGICGGKLGPRDSKDGDRYSKG